MSEAKSIKRHVGELVATFVVVFIAGLALVSLFFLAVGCATTATQTASGFDAMYSTFRATCAEKSLASPECQKAAAFYEAGACAFEQANAYMGGPVPSQACAP